MKRITLVLAMLATFNFNNVAQISEGGLPASFKKTVSGTIIDTKIDYQEIILATPNSALIASEDLEASSKGDPYRIAVLQQVSLSITNAGTWKTLPNGDKIWRLAIRIPQAKALSLYFSTAIAIPEGGKLHAYNGSHSQFVGAYTSKTPSFYAMEMIEGEVLTLEYFMPYGTTQLPTIEIENVAYYYRGVEGHVAAFREAPSVYTKSHQSCEVDVACSEIAGWENQRDAVVQYNFSTSSGTFVCSGVVVNNTAKDCKPYILSANHCGEPTTNANINNHVWYFNYQRPTCTPGNTARYSGARSQTMSGGKLRASSQLGNHVAADPQVSGADFVLIELNSTIPSAFNPYFAGWNRLANAPTSGVGIHHPAGDEKKISTYTSTATSMSYNNGWAGSHWKVNWSATANGHGVTEGGSSGSPLFNPNGLIVGHLSGGSSYCMALNDPDLYGKMNKAWDQEGSNANQQLKAWLDPANTGVTSLVGTYAPCSGGGSGPVAYCAATSINCDEYIEKVTLNTLSKTSGCNNYSDFTASSTTLVKGQTYNLTVTPNILNDPDNFYTNDHIGAWIDWNNDGDFTDAGERIGYVLATTGWSNVFSFMVPTSASSGNLRMRVRLSYSGNDPVMSPCGTTTEGEVEDYTIKIAGGTTNGITESELNSIAIYPNPTTTSFMLNLEGIAEEVMEITVTDITGRLVTLITEIATKPEVNLTNEPSGVYLVKLKATSGIYTHKVIKF